MPDWPKFFYLLVDHPTLIFIPFIIFAALALWSKSHAAWVATAAWILYLVYELGMKAGEFCSGEACVKRTPLYVVYPLLVLLSLVALAMVYVQIRDKRLRKRHPSIPR
jgi:hypothetical protein